MVPLAPADKPAGAQTESLSCDFDLHHAPPKVWRALTDPVLLAEWLLPVVDLRLEPGAAFRLGGPPPPGSGGGFRAGAAAAARLGRRRELPAPRDRSAPEAQLEVGRRGHRHRSDVHA